jgi:hypothetical protein
MKEGTVVQVKLTRNASGPRFAGQAGQTIEVNEADAAMLLADGAAVEAPAPEPKEE